MSLEWMLTEDQLYRIVGWLASYAGLFVGVWLVLRALLKPSNRNVDDDEED